MHRRGTRYHRAPAHVATRDAGGFGERLSREGGFDPKFNPMPGDKYLIYIRGNTLDEATEEALHLAYWLLTRALLEHRRQGRNGDFEAFALEVLASLQKYRHLYTTQDTETHDIH
jgi:hypothetical protein